MWKVNGKVLKRPVPVTINDTRHPAAIFRSWSVEELKEIGIEPYVQPISIVDRNINEEIEFKAKKLNKDVNEYICKHFDLGTQQSFTTIYVLPNTSAEVKSQLEKVWAWVQSVMIEYYIKKATLLSLETVEEVDSFTYDFSQFDETIPEVHLSQVI